MKARGHSFPGRQFQFTALALLLLASSSVSFAAARPHAVMSRFVVIGDSLLAGYQNGSLLGRQQTNGIAALIARQAGVDLALPLIAEPGIPNVLTLVSAGPPPVIVPSPGESTGRIDMLTQTMNLAVPGYTVADALGKRPDLPIDSMTDLILGLPGLLAGTTRSQIEWAEALAPTTILAWIGNNDVLNAANAGTTAALTPLAEFESAYSNIVKRLAATGATVFVANLPDITVTPYIVPMRTVAKYLGVPVDLLSFGLGVHRTDFITLDNAPTIVAILQGTASGPLTADQILDAGEVEQIRAATRAFNRIIAKHARANGAILVDVNAFLRQLARHGAVIRGHRLTTQFLGGIFSLDGVHPSNTGAALTANYIIRTMNRRASARIHPIAVSRIAALDL